MSSKVLFLTLLLLPLVHPAQGQAIGQADSAAGA